ncbi:cyclic nucleotide-binding domain-containing protein [Candidatus Haliotispira prima]|uniref:Cyclic nucleotide-binding domain-containing protein n=1 Tax=Candidatus Haliotispira prima TaxID=3034016 RepID=A0ABY8MHD5_9SPIO|nr:cyclic nucleotide-binding domain-containing protein [Candidatus Haliotispira prima]
MVNIHQIDLRILCGCPMDIVKLLSRKGIIRDIEKDGIGFATGPNAILLSDVATQNGQFCNLIEFPILHMQYKQGMSLPNHPNNTGVRPLLIGLPHQINAQCNYFIRGKYGLISVKELMEAGFDQQQAIDLMRMKMRFNFGRLEKVEEQLDLFFVEGSRRMEIHKGLFIRRIAHNVYEFTFGDDTVQVDLNLFSQENYEIPYNLDYHKPNAEYFSVTHLGEGNGWDADRASMSSLICYQGRYFLVDAPPGVDRLLNAAGISINELEGIFHTHSHDDHFGGLTSLIRSDRRLKYFATKAVRHSVTKKLSAVLSVDERMFFRMFKCFDLEFDRWNEIDGLEVMPLISPHPVETSIFYFRTLWHEGYRCYGHLADTCSDRILESFITDDPTAYGISMEYYTRIKQSYMVPTDLKKVDIGGGLIHGDAIDFKDDVSKKIVLCHIERPLDGNEKEIGTNATFALTDVLIPSKVNFYMKRAEFWLKETLPLTSERDMNMLLNGEILYLNIGTILIKKGENPENIYLLLTGVIGGINVEDDISITLNTGSLVGSSFVLFNTPSNLTFRAESYVTLLEIPKSIYLHILNSHGVTKQFTDTQYRIDYLQSLSLFSDSVGESALRYISQNIGIYESEPGELIDCRDLPGLYIVFQGSIGIFEDNEMKDLFVGGDIFGEETVLPGVRIQYSYETVQKTIIYHIPTKVIHRIPVVQWKLMELHNLKTSRILFTQRESIMDVDLDEEFSEFFRQLQQTGNRKT